MMSTSSLLGGIRRRRAGGKSKKGDMSDDIKTVTIKLQPEYMGGQNNDEPPFNNDERQRPSQENLEEQQVDEPNDDEEVDPDEVEAEPDEVEAEPDEVEAKPDDEEVEPDDETKSKPEVVVEKKTKKQVLVPQLFGFRDQLKMYHWQTQSHSRHVASGEFVTNLTEFIDTFVEVYQGKYGRIQLDNIVSIKLKNMNDTTVIEYLNKYKNYLLYTLPGTLDEVKDTDLLNLKDEMLAEANKLLYLFTLK